MTPPKILIYDIETSLMDVRTFALYQDITNHSHIVNDWHIICICYKELGSNKIHSLTKDETGDYNLCVKMREVLENADILIHHNGDKFDVKKFNSRLITHGLPPLPPLVTVDTLKAIKKIATFSSHRLDYLGKVFGLGGKESTPSNLWPLATDGDATAIKQMVSYCKRDVQLLEDVYLKIRPYIKGHPNLNMFTEGSKECCPNCNSDNLHKRGYTRTRIAMYQRFQCKDCGAWSQGKKNLATNVEVR